MVGMGTTFSEQYVYQERPPAYMKGLKTFLTLVGNFIAFAFNRIIVIQHHGICSQFYDSWSGDMKPPNKQLMEYLVEYEISNTGQLPKISLDLVRRGQMIFPAFQKGSIPFVLFDLVKTTHGHMSAIHEKRKDLFYKLLQLQSLVALQNQRKNSAFSKPVEADIFDVPEE
jgi:hypothetical protein